jgi:hypothetical protein
LDFYVSIGLVDGKMSEYIKRLNKGEKNALPVNITLEFTVFPPNTGGMLRIQADILQGTRGSLESTPNIGNYITEKKTLSCIVLSHPR